MKYLIILIGFMVLFTGCARGPMGQVGSVGPQGPTTTSPATSQSAIQAIVDTENQYRLSAGQEALSPGLTCNLYTVPATTTAIIGATLTNVGAWSYYGVFNQLNTVVATGFNVLPSTLQSLYQSWIVVKCTGDFVVSDDNWHDFDLTSDDGSNLYVDGLLVNDDGLHSAQTKSGAKYLKYGTHSFELDFFQATGFEQLTLNYDGSLLDNTHYYH